MCQDAHYKHPTLCLFRVCYLKCLLRSPGPCGTLPGDVLYEHGPLVWGCLFHGPASWLSYFLPEVTEWEITIDGFSVWLWSCFSQHWTSLLEQLKQASQRDAKCTHRWSANLLNSPFCLCLNMSGFINNSKATLTQFPSKCIDVLWE